MTDSGNVKGELIATCRTLGLPDPTFESESDGPGHAPWFRCTVRLGERDLGHGEGRSKKDAERAASQDALQALQARPPRSPARTPAPALTSPARTPIYAELLSQALLVAHERNETGSLSEVAQDAASLYRQLLGELGYPAETP